MIRRMAVGVGTFYGRVLAEALARRAVKANESVMMVGLNVALKCSIEYGNDYHICFTECRLLEGHPEVITIHAAGTRQPIYGDRCKLDRLHTFRQV